MIDFINDVSRLILIAHEWDVDDALESGLVESHYKHFDEYTSNFYEWIDPHNMMCPLFTLYDLRKYGADNYGLSEEEYNEVEQRCINGCYSLMNNH